MFFRLLPPIIPILVVDLDSPLWQLGLLYSVYIFAGGLFQAPMGVLSDRYDRRYLLIPGFVSMSVGYLVFVAAPVLGTGLPGVSVLGHAFDGPYLLMALGMFVAGFGFSVIHPVGYPLISRNVSPENKGTVLGMWGSAAKFGDMVAPVLVGVLILVTTWEWILVGVSLFGLVYAGGLFLVLRREEYDTRPRLRDGEGTDDADGETSWRSHPRRFVIPMAVVVCSFFFVLFAGNGLQTFTPLFVADVYGYSLSIGGITFRPESIANFYFAILLISGALSQLVVGVFTDLYDHRVVLMTLLGVSAVGLGLLATVTLSPLVLLLVFVVIGSTLFGLNPSRDALISDITPAAYEGRTFGYVWTIAMVGSAAYPVVIGYLGDTIGIQASFGFLALGAVGGLVCIGLLYSPAVYRERPVESADG